MSDVPPPWHERLTREEIRDVLTLHDWRSWLSFATNWGLIGASFALVARWPNPATVLVALFVLSTLILGLLTVLSSAVCDAATGLDCRAIMQLG